MGGRKGRRSKREQKVAANILSTLSANGKWIHRRSTGATTYGHRRHKSSTSGPRRKVISKFASSDQQRELLRLSLFPRLGSGAALVTRHHQFHRRHPFPVWCAIYWRENGTQSDANLFMRTIRRNANARAVAFHIANSERRSAECN